MKLTEFAQEYEAVTGKKVNPLAIRIVEEMDIACQRFEARGFKDAVRGKKMPARDVFLEGGKKLFTDDVDAEMIADLIRAYYTDGYNAGRTQHEG